MNPAMRTLRAVQCKSWEALAIGGRLYTTSWTCCTYQRGAKAATLKGSVWFWCKLKFEQQHFKPSVVRHSPTPEFKDTYQLILEIQVSFSKKTLKIMFGPSPTLLRSCETCSFHLLLPQSLIFIMVLKTTFFSPCDVTLEVQSMFSSAVLHYISNKWVLWMSHCYCVD